MAASGRAGWAAIAVAGLLLLAVLPPWSAPAAEPDPSLPVAAASPICAERYPADGPAGIDLLLGCIVNEVMQSYLGAGAGTSDKPPRVSQWFGPIAIVVAATVALLLVLRGARQRAGRRLAPAAPTIWWSCPGCRSVSAAGTATCYRCGWALEEGATELRADAEPLAPQSFGRRSDVEASDRRAGPGVER